MRFFICFVLLMALSSGRVFACALDDVLKLCIANGGSLAALRSGAERGDWKETEFSLQAASAPSPIYGHEHYTMPSGFRFFVTFQNYRRLFSSTCSLDFVHALTMKENRECSPKRLEAFEAALKEAAPGTVSKQVTETGIVYLVEGERQWLTVVTQSNAEGSPTNVWVEMSVLQGS
jgi:hypothetical protein